MHKAVEARGQQYCLHIDATHLPSVSELNYSVYCQYHVLKYKLIYIKGLKNVVEN